MFALGNNFDWLSPFFWSSKRSKNVSMWLRSHKTEKRSPSCWEMLKITMSPRPWESKGAKLSVLSGRDDVTLFLVNLSDTNQFMSSSMWKRTDSFFFCYYFSAALQWSMINRLKRCSSTLHVSLRNHMPCGSWCVFGESLLVGGNWLWLKFRS